MMRWKILEVAEKAASIEEVISVLESRNVGASEEEVLNILLLYNDMLPEELRSEILSR